MSYPGLAIGLSSPIASIFESIIWDKPLKAFKWDEPLEALGEKAYWLTRVVVPLAVSLLLGFTVVYSVMLVAVSILMNVAARYLINSRFRNRVDEIIIGIETDIEQIDLSQPDHKKVNEAKATLKKSEEAIKEAEARASEIDDSYLKLEIIGSESKITETQKAHDSLPCK